MEHDKSSNTDKHEEGHDHSEHHSMMAEDFKRRFFVSALLSVPVLLLSPTIQGWFNFTVPDFAGSKFLLFALASIVALWAAKPFYAHGLKELKNKRLGMMVLVSIAVGSGYLYSVATTFIIPGVDFYWEVSTLVVFLLFGHWMEMKSVVGASGALRELAKLIPPKANRVENGDVVEVETEDLQKGDIILIRPGEKVPIDGEVIKGRSTVNESMVTGESKPISKEVGDEVVGGTLNNDGSLRVKVTKIGKETAVSQIIQMVKEAQSGKSQTQNLADKAAHYLTLTAIFVGIGTLLVWTYIIGADFLFALTLAITVVVITCPHALGLAIPIVTTVTTSIAAKQGILIKDMDAMERMVDIDYVLFDKTGTLTKGDFGVSDVLAFEGKSEADVLKYAAGVDIHSEHVISKSIVSEAKEREIDFQDADEFEYFTGKGATGQINDDTILLGNAQLMKENGVEIEKDNDRLKSVGGQGKTLIYVALNGDLIGVLGLSDEIKKTSYGVVKMLHDMDIKVAMVTGDNEDVASHVANELDIDVYFSEVLPKDKVDKVKDLQDEGGVVMMVGDGVNDAPALVQSDVGVAIGAGTDVAIASAQVVLVKSDPADVVKLINLGKATMRKMKENLFWATGYNVIAIPLAAGVLAPWDILLRPEWGALIMSASSIIVVANALLLKKQKFNS